MRLSFAVSFRVRFFVTRNPCPIERGSAFHSHTIKNAPILYSMLDVQCSMFIIYCFINSVFIYTESTLSTPGSPLRTREKSFFSSMAFFTTELWDVSP